MESLVYFIMHHSSTVVVALSGSVILCVFGLLLISFHHPKDAVTNELGGSADRIEGVLRQILSEQDWQGKGAAPGPTVSLAEAAAAAGDGDAMPKLSEKLGEVTTDSAAPVAVEAAPTAELAPPPPAIDIAPLENKIKELEEKLAEYSVIEEDIADLSRFRQENDELRKKLTHATGVPAEEAASMPWDDFEKIVKERSVASVKDSVATTIETPAAE